jgi:organic hydroperoxide reductase OsmC/OhrA
MAPPSPYRHLYSVQLHATGGSSEIAAAPAPAITVGPPPQFEGKDTWWSPENLLLGALAACHHATIAAFARRHAIELREVRIEAEGLLDRTDRGLGFVSFKVRVDVDAPSADPVALESLIRRAHDQCIVGRSLAVPVDLELHARAA